MSANRAVESAGSRCLTEWIYRFADQNGRARKTRRPDLAGRLAPPRATSATESALGLRPRRALSSAQLHAEWTIKTSPLNTFPLNGAYPPNCVSHVRGSLQFSPDAKWVTAVKPGDPSHATLLPTGVGESREIPIEGLQSLQDVAYISDGRLMIVGAQPNQAVRCFLRAAEGGPLQPITAEGTRDCRVSPDSRHAVATDGAGVSVYALDGGRPRRLPDSTAMVPIRWVDNRSILAFTQGELPSRIFRIDTANGKRQPIRELVPGDIAGVSQLQTVVATPDAQSFVYNYQQALYELYVVEGLK